MANQPMGAVNPFAQTRDVATANNQLLIAAWDEVERMTDDAGRCGDGCEARCATEKSDIRPAHQPRHRQHVWGQQPRKALLGSEWEREREVKKELVKQQAEEGHYREMPEPLSPKDSVEGICFYVQLSEVEREPGK